MDIVKEVLDYREKYFRCNKFHDYLEIMDKLQIPEDFNYKDCIPKVFSQENYDEIKRFKTKELEKLYDEVKTYAVDKEIDKNKETIIVVHPFYPTLRHANFLIEYPEYFEKYKIYENKMNDLLSNKGCNVILFESPDNFARYTYNFYENGSIKKVIFTEHSTGKVLNKDDLKSLKNKSDYIITGCYGDNCVKDVEEQLEDIKIKRDNELILERAIKL